MLAISLRYHPLRRTSRPWLSWRSLSGPGSRVQLNGAGGRGLPARVHRGRDGGGSNSPSIWRWRAPPHGALYLAATNYLSLSYPRLRPRRGYGCEERRSRDKPLGAFGDTGPRGKQLRLLGEYPGQRPPSPIGRRSWPCSPISSQVLSFSRSYCRTCAFWLRGPWVHVSIDIPKGRL